MEVNVKNKKWLWWTLAILVILIALAVTGGMGYRMGMLHGAQFAQNTDGERAQFPPAFHMHGFEGNSQGMMDRHYAFNSSGFNHRQNFDRFEGRRGGFFPPLYGIFHLVLLGFLIWIGYTLFKKSGWRFVRVAAPQPDEPEITVKAAKNKK